MSEKEMTIEGLCQAVEQAKAERQAADQKLAALMENIASLSEALKTLTGSDTAPTPAVPNPWIGLYQRLRLIFLSYILPGAVMFAVLWFGMSMLGRSVETKESAKPNPVRDTSDAGSILFTHPTGCLCIDCQCPSDVCEAENCPFPQATKAQSGTTCPDGVCSLPTRTTSNSKPLFFRRRR